MSTLSVSSASVFKVGDRVECVVVDAKSFAEACGLRVGQVYTVSAVDDLRNAFYVRLAGVDQHWWGPWRFRLVGATSTAAPRYDVDDDALVNDARDKRRVRGDDWTRGGVAPPREPGYDDPTGDDIAADA